MHGEPRLSGWRWILRACIGAAFLLVAVYAIVWRWVGTPEAAWALLHGDEVAVIPATLDVGDCRAGDEKVLALRVVNLTSSPVRLTGVYTSCSCIVSSSLPAILEPRGESTLRLTVHATGERGRFARQAVLYTDSTASPQLLVLVVGRILDGAGSIDPVPTPHEADDG
jgi:hypothetical protein